MISLAKTTSESKEELWGDNSTLLGTFFLMLFLGCLVFINGFHESIYNWMLQTP